MEIYTGLIMEYLIERATNINPKDDLEKLLKSNKNLRVKLGVDPTAPDVTLGWYAILRMLKKNLKIMLLFLEISHQFIKEKK